LLGDLIDHAVLPLSRWHVTEGDCSGPASTIMPITYEG